MRMGARRYWWGTEYHTSDLLESNGEIRWTIDGGPEFFALGFCDLDSDGIGESIYGAESGAVYGVHSKTGKILWESNIGDRAHIAAIVTAGNECALIVGSGCGEIVRLDSGGRKVWRRNLEGAVIGLFKSRARNDLIAITQVGIVVRLRLSGQIEDLYRLDETLTHVTAGAEAVGTDVFFVVTGDHRVLKIAV